MNAPARIVVDTNKLNAALGRFRRDRAMIIDGREVKGRRETIERSSPAMDGTPELPFGGYRQSGIGRELGRNAVKDYTEEKTFHVHTGPRTNWWLPRGA
jgi:acyl-CoA reductase-like NAD-dependent aldehyde dehydrogenase